MEILGNAGGQVIGFKILGYAQGWIKDAVESWIGRSCLARTSSGTLTNAERQALQDVADKYQTDIDVVGSRGAGQGRNIDTDLPVRKGPGTRSDIDIRYDPDLEINTRGGLTNDLKNIGDGTLIDARPRLPGGTEPPFIRISPTRQR